MAAHRQLIETVRVGSRNFAWHSACTFAPALAASASEKEDGGMGFWYTKQGTLGSQRGFTLPELMPASVIIGLRSAIAVPLYTDMREQAPIAKARAEISGIDSPRGSVHRAHGSLAQCARSANGDHHEPAEHHRLSVSWGFPVESLTSSLESSDLVLAATTCER